MVRGVKLRIHGDRIRGGTRDERRHGKRMSRRGEEERREGGERDAKKRRAEESLFMRLTRALVSSSSEGTTVG